MAAHRHFTHQLPRGHLAKCLICITLTRFSGVHEPPDRFVFYACEAHGSEFHCNESDRVMTKNIRYSRIAAALGVAALCVALTACSSATRDVSHLGGADMSTVEMSPSVGAAPDSAAEAAPVAHNGRSIISEGSITLEVDDVAANIESVTNTATQLGGYVESLHNGGGGTGRIESASLTLRVPADKFEAAFAELSALGTVQNESRSASDVTAQHVDLQARVAALETSVERLQTLMAGATTTSELLEAESALSARQADLDGLQAQLQSLEGQVNEATIWVSLTTNTALPGGPDNFSEGLIAGLKSLAAAGAGALVLLGVLLPWLVVAAVITLIVVALVRASRRRRARKLSVAAPVQHQQATVVQHVQPQSQTVPTEPSVSPAPPQTGSPISGE